MCPRPTASIRAPVETVVAQPAASACAPLDRDTLWQRFFSEADVPYALLRANGDVAEISEAARACLAANDPGMAMAGPELRRLARRRQRSASEGAASFSVVDLGAGLTAVALWLASGDGVVIFQPAAEPPASLSRREGEILRWLGAGKSNQEIGRLLGISRRTVEKHCSAIFAKLGVRDRLGAALAAGRAQRR